MSLLQDEKKPGECYSLLQHDANMIHPDGKIAVGFGQAVLQYLGYLDQPVNKISLTVPDQAKIALMTSAVKMMIKSLSSNYSVEE